MPGYEGFAIGGMMSPLWSPCPLSPLTLTEMLTYGFDCDEVA